MSHNPRRACPVGLGLAGKRLWRAVVSAYDLRVDEVVLLESACRTVDFVAQLDASMVGEPLVVKGSMGQQREHPLLSEARQQRALLARLLSQLKLPDEGVVVDAAGIRSAQARVAANARWAKRAGRR